jgi:hypothetical protein
MGFYDDFRRDCAAKGLLGKNSPLRILRDATVLRAQNVMDYYADAISDSESYNKQLGILTPPWPVFWLEVNTPASQSMRMSNRVMAWPEFGFSRAGALVTTTEPMDTPGVRWRLNFTFFFDVSIVESPPGRDWLHYPFTSGEIDLKDDGYTADERVGYHDPTPGMEAALTSPDMRILIEWNRTILSDVMLLALSFCNCRNVALPETVPVRRAQTKREAKKKIIPTCRSSVPYHPDRAVQDQVQRVMRRNGPLRRVRRLPPRRRSISCADTSTPTRLRSRFLANRACMDSSGYRNMRAELRIRASSTQTTRYVWTSRNVRGETDVRECATDPRHLRGHARWDRADVRADVRWHVVR